MFVTGRAFVGILCVALTASATTQSFFGLGTSGRRTSKPPIKSFVQLPYIKHYDDGLFTPVEHLGALSEAQFTTLSHPVFPNYSIRIKKSSDFCDGTVK